MGFGVTPIRTMLALVRDTAERYPQRAAVCDAAGDLSYADLMARVESVARRLSIRRGDRIGICSNRSVDIITAQLAIWSCGGCCVPLDPQYPQQRLRSMVVIAGIDAVLIGEGAGDAVRDLEVTSLPVGGRHDSRGRPRHHTHPHEDDVAFVFFTSGTSGLPKPVLVPHVGLWNRVTWGIRFHDLGSSDRVLWKAPFCFDASVAEIYSALGSGGRVVVAPRDSERDPAQLSSTIIASGVTVMHSVPPMLRALADEPTFGACQSLRHVWSGGQILYERDARRLCARVGARLTNQYGPTEASINATAGIWRSTDVEGQPVSVGHAIDGMQAYVLTDDLREVPVGETGELYLGGVGLAHGYLGGARATAAAFVPDHLSGLSGARLYRTGDLALRLGDNDLAIVGRVDNQVKIRGFRVEPEEVAATLASHPGVADAATIAQVGKTGEISLLAYAVPRPERRQTFHGLPRVICREDLSVVSLNDHETRFLFEDIFTKNAYLRHGLSLADGDVVVDVGANIGMFMLFAFSQSRPERYIAFEPNPLAARVFRANAELYGLTAELHEVAVGAVDGQAELTSYDEFSYLSGLHADPERETALVASFLERASAHDDRIAEGLNELRELATDRLAARSEVVRVQTLSGLFADLDLDNVGLLKINVERSELAVLEGLATHDWRRIRQVALELEDTDGALEHATHLLVRQGFEVAVDEDWSVGRDQGIYYLYARPPEVTQRPATQRRMGSMPLTTEDVRDFLAQRLPTFMLPATIELVEELPMTPSGKTDVASLRRGGEAAEEPQPSSSMMSSVERRVADIWIEVLGRDRVDAQDDIFELGAHSVTVARLVARIRAAFGVRLPLKIIFQTRTLARLAAAITEALPEEAGGTTAVAAQTSDPTTAAATEFDATAGQRALWLLQQIDRGRSDYNDYHLLDLHGDLDRTRFEQSLSAAVGCQTMMRVALVYDGGVLKNVVRDDAHLELRELDLSDRDDADVDGMVRTIVNEPFDLGRPPLLRAALIGLGADRHLLVLVAHHAVCDEWSWRVLWDDVCRYYAGERVADTESAYRDFAAIERQRIDHDMEGGLRFWVDKLRGVETGRWGLPASPTQRLSGSGRRLQFTVPFADLEALRTLAARCGATAFMPFLAAYAWLLRTLITADNPVIGVPVSLRDRVELEKSVGYYVNMNAMLCSCEGNPTFAEQVERVRDAIVDADSYRWVPFDRVVKAVNPSRRGVRNPLFQSVIVQHDEKDLSRPLADGVVATERRWHNATSKFDLTLEVGLRVDRAECSLEYATDIFDDNAAETVAVIFTKLVAVCSHDPQVQLSDVFDDLRSGARSSGELT